jgi:hypothetical protein
MPKNSAKKLSFLAQNTTSFCKNWIITLALKKTAISFAENFRNSHKLDTFISSPENNFIFILLRNPKINVLRL